MKTDNTAFPTFSWGGAKLALSFSVFCQALLGLKYFVPRHKLGMKDWGPSPEIYIVMTEKYFILLVKNYPYHIECVSWHKDLKNEIKKNVERKKKKFPRRGGGVKARGKIPPNFFFFF